MCTRTVRPNDHQHSSLTLARYCTYLLTISGVRAFNGERDGARASDSFKFSRRALVFRTLACSQAQRSQVGLCEIYQY